jgi:hypothetical protein
MNIGRHKNRLSEWSMPGWQLCSKKKPRLQVQEEAGMQEEVAMDGCSLNLLKWKEFIVCSKWEMVILELGKTSFPWMTRSHMQKATLLPQKKSLYIKDRQKPMRNS